MIEVRQGPKQNDLQLGTNTTSEMGSTEEHLPPARNALVRNAEDNKKPEARKQLNKRDGVLFPAATLEQE